MAETKRRAYEILRSQLEIERSSFLPHWRMLGDFILPRRPRFSTTDVNRGDRRNQNIIDSTGTLAARTLRSGMMGGLTSPARPWFKLSTPDPDLAEYGSVKRWLDDVTKRMNTVFLKSNLYNSLPIIYGDMGTFATAAMGIEEDFDDTIRTYPFPIGSYMIANDDKLRVNVFFREFRYTIRQLVMKFGKYKDKSGAPDWSMFSSHVKDMWDKSEYEQWIDVCHIIQPNPEFDTKKLDSKFKKFLSCYYEKGTANAGNQYITDVSYDKYLRESGYDYFPILAPRWEVNGEDVYGTDCPGMSALGDIKQLQLMQKRKAQAVEKMVNPPMTGPTSLRSVKTSILPGDITYSDEREGIKGFRPAHEVNARIAELVEDIRDIRQTIRKAYFEDLFLMLAQSDRREITAREIDERHEEKLLALGPVLEQTNQDMLDPLIDITYNNMVAQGKIPEPPEELNGIQLKVEYISVMAQAQKLVGISGIERLSSFVANYTANTKDPSMMRKINAEQVVDVYAERLGVDQSIIRTDEEVGAIKEAEQQAQKAAATQQMIQSGAAAAKDLSGAGLEDDNALKRILDQAKAGQLAGAA